jgi:hypothetical protein
MSAEKPMTRLQAMAEFRSLVARYGLQWTARDVQDQSAWDRMEAVNKILTVDDRREALGMPARHRDVPRYERGR